MSQKNETVATLSDVKKIFTDNVLNAALLDARGSDDVPTFYGSSHVGESGAAIGVKDPPAIPSSDLKSVRAERKAIDDDTKFPNPGDMMKGQQVYSAIIAVMVRLGNLRKYKSNWYHQVQGSLSLVNSVQGKAIFQDNLSELPKYTAQANTAKSGWVRNKQVGKIAYDIPALNTSGEMLSFDRISKFFTELYTSWQNVYNDEITYTFYTCHQNCHGNCHGSRGRR